MLGKLIFRTTCIAVLWMISTVPTTLLIFLMGQQDDASVSRHYAQYGEIPESIGIIPAYVVAAMVTAIPAFLLWVFTACVTAFSSSK